MIFNSAEFIPAGGIIFAMALSVSMILAKILIKSDKINGPEFVDDFTADAAINHWLTANGGNVSKHLDGHKTSNL